MANPEHVKILKKGLRFGMIGEIDDCIYFLSKRLSLVEYCHS